MKLFFRFFVLFFLLLTINSCNEEPSKPHQGMLKTSGGKTSEVLVVINNSLWKSIVGDSIRAVLQNVDPWLAQAEPAFDLTHIPPKVFAGVYKKYRNTLVVKIGNDVTKNIFKGRKNVYAKPQAIFELKCKTTKDFLKMFGQKSAEIVKYFHRNELIRIQNIYRGIKVDSVMDRVQKQFDFTMVFPKGFYVAKTAADFAWLRKITPDIEEGILIYTKPYSDTSEFNYKNIIAYRNQITKKYVPGPLEDTYMKVSDVFPPYWQSVDFKGSYATLLRSWWDVKGYALGGPFLSYTFVDTVANRLITIDGYIKAPRKDKRDLLLHLEAIINSFEMKSVKD